MRFVGKSLLAIALLLLGFVSLLVQADEQPDELSSELLLNMISPAISQNMCEMPEIKQCFAISKEECVTEVVKVVEECKTELADELPEKVSPANAADVAIKLTECLTPKLRSAIGDKKIDTPACR